MVTRRGTSNGNAAGSSYARRRRKWWLLNTFGDGITVQCAMETHHPDCPGELGFAELTVDRYPVAGIDGGTYRRDNIRPAFGLCNSLHGGPLWKSKQ